MRKVLLAVFLLALVAPFASAVDSLPAGPWKDLLHLGATPQDRITGGQIDVDYLNGEANVMPAPGDEVAGIEGATNDPLVWTPLHDDDGRWEPNLENYVMYYHIYILSPDQKDVTFLYGHDDDLRVWNNGELVISQGGSLDNQTQDAVLYAGINSITIKHKEGGGGDWFKVAVTDRAGNDLTDLQYALAPVGIKLVNTQTGSTDFTSQPTVNVEWQDEGIDVAGYQLTETDVEPAEWQTTAPASYTLPDTVGDYTVYGWIQTAAGQVLQSSATITYTTLAPVASAQNLLVEMLPPDYPAAVIYPSDADAGSNDPNGGELLTGPEYYYISCPDDQTPDQPFITLDAGTAQTYNAILNVTNEAGLSASVPFTVEVVAAAEPTTDHVVWSGEAGKGNTQWSRGLNWELDQPPANPTNGNVTFTEAGSVAEDDTSVTNTLDAGAAVAVTANAEPFAISSDAILGISVSGGPTQLVTFSSEDYSAATAQQIADALNAFATSYTASATADGKVEIAANNAANSSLLFSNMNGAPVEALGLPLDAPVVSEWTIGKLIVNKTALTDDFQHRTDLNGSKLNIQYDVEIAKYSQGNEWGQVTQTFENGTVQIGKPNALRFVTIGRAWGGNTAGILDFEPGTKLVPYINVLGVGWDNYKSSSTSILDLRGCEVADGTLSVRQLIVSHYNNAPAYIMIDDSTGLDTIEAANYLMIAANSDGGSTGYIGDPDNNWLLPAGMNIKLGSKNGDTIHRCNLEIGWTHWGGEVEGKLAASSGGDFEAYLNNMQIGTRQNTRGGYVNGLLDISQMDSCMIDANTVSIGVGSNAATSPVDGRVLLPSGGTMTANTITMGDAATDAFGLIDLPSATLTVNQSLTINHGAKIAVHVDGSSCGLELADAATLAATSDGVIEINFNQDQIDETGTYYGLRWAGNHVGDLKPLMDSGNLVVNNATSKPIATVSYDDTDNATYVTVVDSLPLTAVGKNLTIEVSPVDPTVVLYPEDVEAGSFDPNGYSIVEYLVNSTDDQTPDQPYVTLTGLGEYTVTLIVKNDNDPADLASTDCTVTLVEPAASTTDNVKWSGGAALSGMERNEWIWGSNWIGGNAPINPTDATLTFADLGMGTNKLDDSRVTLIGTRSEPFLLYDGDQVAIDSNGTLITYTFTVDQFNDIASISAQEIVDILNADAAGFEASAIDGKIVLTSEPGNTVLQVVDVIDGTAARLGLPTGPATALRTVGTIEFLNPANSGLDTVEHTTDLNGMDLIITKSLKSGWYSDEHTDHKGSSGTFLNGNLLLGAPGAPIDILVGYPGYGGTCDASLTFGAGTTVTPVLRTVHIGSSVPGGGPSATLDLREASIAGNALKMQNLYVSNGVGGQTFNNALMIGSSVQLIEATDEFIVGGGRGCALAYIGDPDNEQKLPAGTSIKVGSDSAPANFVLATSSYGSSEGKVVATSGGTFEAYATDMIISNYDGPIGATVRGTLDVAAMDSCAINTNTMSIGTGAPTGSNARFFGTVNLPPGTATVDALTMGSTDDGFLAESAALLQLNGTDFSVATSATLHTGSTVDIQLDGTSSGLDIADAATLAVEDGAVINVTFAAPTGSDPYYGIRWAGSHETELQALIDAGKITADTTNASGDLSVFTDAEYTYVGLQAAAPTWPIEGDANMDCKVNIIDLIFVRNRLNGDVASDDNWQADVNSDGKINIIDLIYVRNRLNSKCPE